MKRLILVLGIFAAVAVGTPQNPDFDGWERDMLAGRFAEAAEYAASVAEFQTRSGVWAYRAGASAARSGDLDSALDWLAKASERRYSGVRTFETDTDIDLVRGDARFLAIIEKVKANAAARMEIFKKAAGESKPIVIKPPGFDPAEPTPILLVLHGTGQIGKQMVPAWRRAAARTGCVLIAPDAIRPAGKGFSWTFRDESEWYVQELIEQARAEYAVGPVIIAGFSQGANIALAMGRSHPTVMDAVIPVCGHWESRVGEIPAEGERPDWCLLIGANDPWAVTYDEAEEALKAAGLRVRMTKVEGVGHALPRPGVLEDAIRWCLEEPDSSDEASP